MRFLLSFCVHKEKTTQESLGWFVVVLGSALLRNEDDAAGNVAECSDGDGLLARLVAHLGELLLAQDV